MNRKAAYRFGLLVLGALMVIGFLLRSTLPIFARRIADADRVVATMWPSAHSPAKITLTGTEARRIIQAVSSAKRERPPWGMDDACIYDVWVTFFQGTNELGRIETCSSLFILKGKKYREDSGVLAALAVGPVHSAFRDWWRERQGTQ